MKLKLFLISLKQSSGKIILEGVTLLASFATIFKEFSLKNFNLSNFNFFDWFKSLTVLLLVVAIIAFLYEWYKILRNWGSLVLPKKTFFKYVAYQLSKVSHEIKNIAGDLSWLEDQKETYFSLANNSNLHIVIYYSANRVTDQTKLLITEYESKGMRMIPYPSELQPKHIKGILIDKDENGKFLSFTKVDDGESIRCTKYYGGTNEYHMATAFIDCIEKYLKLEKQHKELSDKNKKQIFIGVSGINNIGKSSLCLQLKLKYGENNMAIIEDSFIREAKKSTFEVALFCLLNQILDYQRIKNECADKSYFLFDRTPIDNLAFLMHYQPSNEYDSYIEHLKKEVYRFMSSFDVIALLYHPDKSCRLKKTSFLEPKVRKKLPNKINELYQRAYLEKVIKYPIRTYKNKDDFKTRIEEIVNDLSEKVDTKK